MHKPKSLLIIDNEPDWIEQARESLSDEFERVEEVLVEENAQLKGLIERRPDVILLDINMPIMGDEVHDAIRKCNRRSRIIIWSVLPETDESVRRLLNDGAKFASKNKDDMGFGDIRDSVATFKFKDPEEIRALIVDDDTDNTSIYSNILNESNITRIDTAVSTDEAREKLVTESYDLILLDTYFVHKDGQRPDGLALLEELRHSRLVHWKVILLLTRHDDRTEYTRSQETSNIIKVPVFSDFEALTREAREQIVSGLLCVEIS